MAQVTPGQNPALDGTFSRNNTKVFIIVNGKRVGRVQSFRRDRANNVQVLTELGRDVAVELKKGVSIFSFTIAKFATRKDVFDDLEGGRVFSLMAQDTAALNANGTAASSGREVLDYFSQCMIQSISHDYTIGTATVGMNAQVVTIGKGGNA